MPASDKRHSAAEIIRLIRVKKSAFWEREREARALRLFHEAARRVPAYKDFLKKQRINPAKIRTFTDFQAVPPTSKKDYLRQYPLEKLTWDGSLKKPLVFTSTSGSTGEPFYFPRGERLDWEYSVLAEMFLQNSSYKTGGPVLVIIGFGMGVWIGGLITYKAFEIASRRADLPVSIITPGINKQEIFNALRNLSPHYQETILVGYAPFIKDVLDEAAAQGIQLKRLHIRILTAAEAYTEKFRDYLVRKVNAPSGLKDTLNIYGTADIGAMAYETPLSILVRQLAMGRWRLFADIFHQIQRTPTLAQYNPLFITFEEVDGELLLTGNNTFPLVRYAVGDHGGVFSYGTMIEKCSNHGINLLRQARTRGIGKFIYQLPFVYVYERVDFATTLYGLQIYPETVREVLINPPMNKYLTGKLTLITKFDRRQNQYLEINLELRKHRKIPKKVEKVLLSQIVANLRLKNSEYRELHTFIKDRVLPKLVFWPAEHPLHFKPGIKQKWVKK